MRGVFLQQQLEFRLSVDGENFKQGDTLPCMLTIHNHTDVIQDIGNLKLCLALGDIKKVRGKLADAFTVLEEATLVAGSEIKAGEELQFEWECKLDKNAVVTDKSQSLYLLFGNSQNINTLGQLLVTVQPHPVIESIITTLSSAFQFVAKSYKSSKNGLAIKIAPSSATRFAMLDLLTLNVKIEGDTLQMKYVFDLKKFEATALSLAVGKNKITVQQTLDNYIQDGYINHSYIESKIEDAFKEANL